MNEDQMKIGLLPLMRLLALLFWAFMLQLDSMVPDEFAVERARLR